MKHQNPPQTLMEKLILVYIYARDLEEFLGHNAGTSADWPVDIVCRDEQTANKLTEKLDRLRRKVKEISE